MAKTAMTHARLTPEVKKDAEAILSPDEFESWRETMNVRFEADLMQEIKNGLTSMKKGKASLYTLEELLPES